MFRNVLFVDVLLCLCCVSSYAQTTINVPADQPTIQAGINAAVNGDTVLVADGVYHELINFNGKNITVTSTNGPDVTIIDGAAGQGPVVRIINHEGRGAVLDGFTIRHGGTVNQEGGGIRIDHASPTITRNIITRNTGLFGGGGINAFASSPIIDSNTVSENNLAAQGGGTQGNGIFVVGSDGLLAKITNNTISGNYTQGLGGGIGLNDSGPILVENNLITGNAAAEGGGIAVLNANGELIVQNLITGNFASKGTGLYIFHSPSGVGYQVINNTIAGNDAHTSVVLWADGYNTTSQIENNIVVTSGNELGLQCNEVYHLGPPMVKHNDIFSTLGVATSYAGDCTGFSGNNGNISVDPMFVSSPDDFHLLSDSPAIDVGDNSAPSLPELDFEGNPRIVDATGIGTPIIDMGVYEFQISLSPSR